MSTISDRQSVAQTVLHTARNQLDALRRPCVCTGARPYDKNRPRQSVALSMPLPIQGVTWHSFGASARGSQRCRPSCRTLQIPPAVRTLTKTPAYMLGYRITEGTE